MFVAKMLNLVEVLREEHSGEFEIRQTWFTGKAKLELLLVMAVFARMAPSWTHQKHRLSPVRRMLFLLAACDGTGLLALPLKARPWKQGRLRSS